ncbi:MAG: hypothetical protein QOI74_3193, partial [Micromonosporaceae bacterium]|nr:hypothetical protein [Micromonosporaceae bacterium]
GVNTHASVSAKNAGFLGGGYGGGGPMAVTGLAALVALAGFMFSWYRRRDRAAVAAGAGVSTMNLTGGAAPTGADPGATSTMVTQRLATTSPTAAPAPGMAPSPVPPPPPKYGGRRRVIGEDRSLVEEKGGTDSGDPGSDKPDDDGYIVI